MSAAGFGRECNSLPDRGALSDPSPFCLASMVPQSLSGSLLRLRSRRCQSALIHAFVIIFSLAAHACKESLPPYVEPVDFLTGRIEGAYVLRLNDNSMRVYFTVKNVFDETLQAPAYFHGTIKVISSRDDSVRKTFTVTTANVISAPGYERSTGILTFPPGDSIWLGVSWDFTDDRGRDLRREFFRYIIDPTCYDSLATRCLAYTEYFALSGEITIFKQRAPVVARGDYALCFVSRFVAPKYCPPIITTDPCNLHPPQPVRGCFPTDFNPIH